jgi:NOL1/NOP2/fmu family ribosome biogenesis protein
MNKIQVLNTNKKQEILNKLKEQFGVKSIPGILLKRGAERIFLFQGSFDEKQIKKFEKIAQIERIGIYFAKEQNGRIRLSIEGVYLLKDQIIKNIFELTDKDAEIWMKGQELNLQVKEKGFLIMKHKEDFLACGKSSEKKITNFIPKSRRLRFND